MQIFVNGESMEIEDGSSLASVIALLKLAPEQCATAVNSEFVARGERALRRLQANDQIMTFEPITGG
ncbi:MAG: sulfur carrier protein ThiS [Betaproteobacteria bacterium]|jgi:thiamine biosynthesis protein ThiS|nr:sulfur carrier protein ThiS [Betaproteobacteria bacterium]